MRVVSIFGVVNRILVAAANHVRKRPLAIAGKTLLSIPELDGLGRIASEFQLFIYS
jgi:hypothetical protein